ncbi:MAG: DUF4301 family protein [Planctomycetes bacterium]|nr:DUF4301 family protein [Planctomycetota bacterium]
MQTEIELFPQDYLQLQELGIRAESVQNQYQILQQGSNYIQLVRPCTWGSGIVHLHRQYFPIYYQYYEKALQEERFLKFVPASGAASRMFDNIDKYLQQSDSIPLPENPTTDQEKELHTFCTNLHRFPFYKDLQNILQQQNLNLEIVQSQNDYRPIFQILLQILQYRTIPKALLPFHFDKKRIYTALEDHIYEAIAYSNGCVHFTILKEKEHEYKSLEKTIREHIFHPITITYSYQDPSTQSIALDLTNNIPLRDEDNRLIFHPGGHGSLLQNLEETKGDIVFIKNIDNVLAPTKQTMTIFYKQILAGYFLSIQDQIHKSLHSLENNPSAIKLREIYDFVTHTLNNPIVQFSHLSQQERIEQLYDKLYRPFRVCGMVRHNGEVGGGPFWTLNNHGQLSLQIVEKQQVNINDEQQKQIWQSATYVNPVDLVCGLQDHHQKPYELKKYIDISQTLISNKTYHGKDIRVIEHPGLWNGGMAQWNTIFVDTPIHIFNPVKKITDLLNPWHSSRR